jgi:hypothetical protein
VEERNRTKRFTQSQGRAFRAGTIRGAIKVVRTVPCADDLVVIADDLEELNALATFYAEHETNGESIDDPLKALSSDVMVNTLAGVGILKALNKLKPSLDRLLSDLDSIRRSKPKKAQDAQA